LPDGYCGLGLTKAVPADERFIELLKPDRDRDEDESQKQPSNPAPSCPPDREFRLRVGR
jgi:hypothetical protein